MFNEFLCDTGGADIVSYSPDIAGRDGSDSIQGVVDRARAGAGNNLPVSAIPVFDEGRGTADLATGAAHGPGIVGGDSGDPAQAAIYVGMRRRYDAPLTTGRAVVPGL